jgi:hypothetical protein
VGDNLIRKRIVMITHSETIHQSPHRDLQAGKQGAVS